MRGAELLPIALLSALCGFVLAVGCSDDPIDGAATLGAGASAGTAGAGTTTSTGTGDPPAPAECQGHIYECGDALDNDGDNLSDYQDPDCLGPCDDTEDSYFGGIPGSIGPPCLVDCYFDQDSGSGNDGCYWNHKCDEHEVAPGYHPESNNGAACAYDPGASTPGTNASCSQLYQMQLPQCLDYCGPLTPNGCDCFGCCELPAGGGQYVWLGSDADNTKLGSCTTDTVNDPSRCEPCTPVAACLNGCDVCELCVGKDELPPGCDGDGGTSPQCPTGVQPCGLPGQELCPPDYYCITPAWRPAAASPPGITEPAVARYIAQRMPRSDTRMCAGPLPRLTPRSPPASLSDQPRPA